MKKPPKLTVISSHQSPMSGGGRAAQQQVPHYINLYPRMRNPREADAEEMFEFDVDFNVHLYLAGLFFNLVEGPDALIELPERDEDSETAVMFHLALFLQSSGLAEQNVSSPSRIQFVTTKKALRRSSWLFARDAPGERRLEYFSRLTLKAFRFLEEVRLSDSEEDLAP